VDLMLELGLYYDEPTSSIAKQCKDVLLQHQTLINEFDAEVS
jgi:hypothetical protein